MLIALIPLGILSFAQTQNALKQVSETTLDGIAGATLRAVQRQIDLITEAQISARLLASIFASTDLGDVACIDRVSAVASSLKEATMVAFSPPAA